MNIQTAYFRNVLSEEMKTYIRCAVNINIDGSTSISQILNAIENHLRGKRNITMDRVQFEDKKQDEYESFDDFFVSAKELALQADFFKTCFDERMTTKVITSVKSQELRQKLLSLNPFPSLQTVVDISRSFESATRDADFFTRNKISKIKTVNQENSMKQKIPEIKKERKCWFCGYNRHTNRLECPARDKECKICGKIGHFSSVCKKKNFKVNDIRPETELQEDTNETDFVDFTQVINVSSSFMNENRTPKITIKIKTRNGMGTLIKVIPDTGAEISIAGKNLLEKSKVHQKTLTMRNSTKLIAANE